MKEHSSSRSILKNSALNFGTQLLVVVVAFISLPILVRTLSPSDFGLLSLLWAVIGYFTLFDFGISRAVTKMLSGARDTSDSNEITSIIWASLAIGAVIGSLGMLLLYVFSPALLELLNIEPVNYAESLRSFRAAAVGIPFMVLYGILRGIQTAYYKFSLMNIYQFILGTVQWVGSVIVVSMGYGLYEVIICIVIGRMIVTLLSFLQLPFFITGFNLVRFKCEIGHISRLLRFGGWISVSQILSPIFSYLDRFFIGRFVSIAAVGYYTIPSEMLSRILIIAMSIVGALFPMMSEVVQRDVLKELYLRSIRFLIVALVPLILVLMLFSREVLTLWVGKTVAEHSYVVFIIVCLGIFFNSIAQIPTTLLHAIDRPKYTGILNMAEIPLIIALNILLIPSFGIIGAAVSWTVRVIVDCGLLIILADSSVKSDVHKSYFPTRIFMLIIMAASAVTFIVYQWEIPLLIKIFIAVSMLILYSLSAWGHAFFEQDRNSLRLIFKKIWMG